MVAFDALVFAAQVDEADIARIEVGQAVEVSLDAFADETFEATVERIDRTAITTTTGGTVTVGRFTDARAEITDGLDEGATVAVTGLGELADGASVKVK